MRELRAGDIVQSDSIMGNPVGRVSETSTDTQGLPTAFVEWEEGVQTIGGNTYGWYEQQRLRLVDLPEDHEPTTVEAWLAS